jgi:hypothetical protein
MRRLVLLAALIVVLTALLGGTAAAVNDPFVPGDECSASDTAVGHPAAANERSDKASAPFSLNNPGVSTGARAGANQQATEDHCPNAA